MAGQAGTAASHIKRWGHINVNATNLETSIRFYEALGFKVAYPMIPYIGHKRGESFTADEELHTALGLPKERGGAQACVMELEVEKWPKLDLSVWDKPTGKAMPNDSLGIIRICLVTADLDAEYARLKQIPGVRFLAPPLVRKAGFKFAILQDPDGAMIELIQGGKAAMRWGHINVNATNLETSVRFYSALGFKVAVPNIPYIGHKRGESVRADPEVHASLGLPAERGSAQACIMEHEAAKWPKLDLSAWDKPTGRATPNDSLGIVRICLATTDLDADYTRLKATVPGVRFLAPPLARAGGFKLACLQDPDGSMIELIELPKAAAKL